VKEATGDLGNMELTRKLCGEDFEILSGDDDKTFEMMTSPQIKADGVISVISNVVPKGVSDMVRALNRKSLEEATKLAKGLEPFFKMVTVRTTEDTPYGSRLVKARNPLPCKTLMNLLGMPSGPCRRPLGKMTKAGLETVLKYARKVYETNPELLEPIESFFDVDMSKRLYEERFWSKLHYV
jgi:4-hydroxy-tetrahydrodipicolinate synthase